MSDLPRRAILVLGVHRSGTSALTRVVSLLGAHLPADLYPPDALNPTGYFESQHIVGLNEWMLGQAGASWANCLGFSAEQLAGPSLPGIMASIVNAVKQVFADQTLFVLKDPRLCLLLDFWLPALHSLGIAATVLIVLRSPIAVAQSLRRRNRVSLPEGMALWLRYVLAAEFATRALPRAVVGYEALLADWRAALASAGRTVGLPPASVAAAAEIDAFLRGDLRHDGAVDAAADPVPWQFQTWTDRAEAALEALGHGGEPMSALRALDEVRAQFAGWCQLSRA